MSSPSTEALAADVPTETTGPRGTMTVPSNKRDSGSRGRAEAANNGARRTSAIEAAEQCGRDTGPVSTRNSSKGALITEAHAVFRKVRSGATPEELRVACFAGKVLRQAARETRRRIWWALHWRYFSWNPPQWVLADLGEASAGDVTDRAFVGLAYLHYVRRDRLTFDFVTDRLWARHHSKAPDVTRDDVLDFLASYECRDSGIKKWRESTRKKLAGNVLSALRDFGVLTGVQRKSLLRPVVPPEVALHLCRLLDCEGLRGRALLEAKDWRLFLWEPHDTSLALAQLAQRGDIRFERSGRTVVLEIPEHPHGGSR